MTDEERMEKFRDAFPYVDGACKVLSSNFSSPDILKKLMVEGGLQKFVEDGNQLRMNYFFCTDTGEKGVDVNFLPIDPSLSQYRHDIINMMIKNTNPDFIILASEIWMKKYDKDDDRTKLPSKYEDSEDKFILVLQTAIGKSSLLMYDMRELGDGRFELTEDDNADLTEIKFTNIVPWRAVT